MYSVISFNRKNSIYKLLWRRLLEMIPLRAVQIYVDVWHLLFKVYVILSYSCPALKQTASFNICPIQVLFTYA